MNIEFYLTILLGISVSVSWLLRSLEGNTPKPERLNLLRSVTWNG